MEVGCLLFTQGPDIYVATWSVDKVGAGKMSGTGMYEHWDEAGQG